MAHHITSHLTPRDMAPHHITPHDMTSHGMTSRNQHQPTTLPHLTSPRSQPHCFISPRNQPHDIIPHHMTAHHITTTETQPATTKTPPPDRTIEGWCTKKIGLGSARVERWPCAHSVGKFFLWLKGFSLSNFRPRLARKLLV